MLRNWLLKKDSPQQSPPTSSQKPSNLSEADEQFQSESDEELKTKRSRLQIDEKNVEASTPAPGAIVHSYDIGNAVKKNREKDPISDDEKHKYLTETWKPDKKFEFPSEMLVGGKTRKFRYDWLEQYSWLAYSQIEAGGFCKYCVIFAPSEVGKASQQVTGILVLYPLKDRFKHATETLKHHEKTRYHNFSMEKSTSFLHNFDKGETVNILLNSQMQQTIEKNRKRLIPIVKTLIFCGQNNIPLRGHRDDKVYLLETEKESLRDSEGIFKHLLRFRLDAGDADLKDHLETCGKTWQYISKTIQNEIIASIGHVIKNHILKRIKAAKFFSILCDETTDISTKEQMSFCIRYVDSITCAVREDFLGFFELQSTTGEAIKNAIVEELGQCGLSLENLRGQGYDGGANMAGKFRGVQALILADQPLAFYTHCFNHSLNLCILKASNVPSIRNMIGIVSSIGTFFSSSAKRSNTLKETINDSETPAPSKKTKLKSMCATRWMEYSNSVQTFYELFPFIVESLQKLEEYSDTETSKKALTFNAALTRSDFLIAVAISLKVDSYSVRLSKILQSKNEDISSAYCMVKEIISVLDDMRLNADTIFHDIFLEAQKLADFVNTELAVPRLCSKQKYRGNAPYNDPEEYYRVQMFIPYVEFYREELKSRFAFADKSGAVYQLEKLIPSKIVDLEKNSMQKLIEASLDYENDMDIGSKYELEGELNLWQKRWQNLKKEGNDIPADIFSSLKEAGSMFPNIKILLQILLTLPVTTATPERTFSCLKRLKTYLRSTMGGERLSGLALLNIHREMEINIEDVIDHFGRTKPRRMTVSDWK